MNNCVISCVGKSSLHEGWLNGKCDFDLYLINYDEPGSVNGKMAKKVCNLKGIMVHLIYQFLTQNPEILDQYDYLFFPDDDLLMTSSTINRLFDLMERYQLQIAQPSLAMSYFSWTETLRNPYCKLRYTNFVEVMAPCFSKQALKKVLFTFNENSSGYGIEFRWPLLIKTNYRDIAIIDEISVVHTRPIQSNTTIAMSEFMEYLEKYNLSVEIKEYGSIPSVNHRKIFDRVLHSQYLSIINSWIDSEKIASLHVGVNGYFGYAYCFVLFAQITQRQEYVDLAVDIINRTHKYIVSVKHDMTYANGIIGCCCVIEYMSNHGFIKTPSEEILGEIDKYIDIVFSTNLSSLNIDELCGIIRYYTMKLENKPSAIIKERLHLMETIVLKKLKMKDLADISLDVACVLPSLLVKRNDYKTLRKWESQLIVNISRNIYQIYSLFAIFKQTGNNRLLGEIRRFFKRMPSLPNNLHEAILMCEMLAYHRNKNVFM